MGPRGPAARAAGGRCRPESRQFGLLLEDDPSLVHARGPNQATPLHFAGSERVAARLVERGADMQVRDKYGSTPLRAAAYAGARRRSVARYLARFEEPVTLHLAVALGDADAVVALLDADPSGVHAPEDHLNPASGRGGTALHVAASLGDTRMAALLLARGADPNALSGEGHAPLHYAARTGNRELIELLLEHGASRTLHDAEHGGTPLDWADFFEQRGVADVLRPD